MAAYADEGGELCFRVRFIGLGMGLSVDVGINGEKTCGERAGKKSMEESEAAGRRQVSKAGSVVSASESGHGERGGGREGWWKKQ